MMHRQSLYFVAPNEVAVHQDLVPSLGRGEVLVRADVSAISPGTEMLFYRDLVPGEVAIDATISGLDKPAA